MRIMAQMRMVMNLDKCIGCHTCSVTCKQTWTNRPGTEYVYFNNVETKPGTGYPRRYEDQETWHGGWTLDRKGRLQLRAGGRVRRLLSIFWNPDLPQIDDYGDPWTYDYQTLLQAPPGTLTPSARSVSALTGRDMRVRWGSNWDDDLAGGPAHAADDPDLAGLGEQVKLAFEQVFMFYLPRICEHCLNPSCVASCPSGAMYKREEDGIVLVDQDRCRGWRFCVSGCPYKKVYFNHRTGKAEKCTLCFPRIESGQPTICAETCVGRLRYLGLMLYDADAVLAAAATPEPRDLYEAQLSVFLDPFDPSVQAEAARQGIPADWLDAAIGGHVLGVLIPERWTHAIGIPETAYRWFSAAAGTLAAVLIILGVVILAGRRLFVPRVRATTSPVDYVALVLLLVIIVTGIVPTLFVNLLGHGYDYRVTVAPWFRGLFSGSPDVTTIAHAPVVYQVHAASAWLIWAVWPFSRLVHAWSVPLWYLWRPYIVYRSRVAAAPAEPGTGGRRWRKIGVPY